MKINKKQEKSPNLESHQGWIVDPIKNTHSHTNCSGVDYDGMCGIRKDLVNHHVISRTQGVNKYV